MSKSVMTIRTERGELRIWHVDGCKAITYGWATPNGSQGEEEGGNDPCYRAVQAAYEAEGLDPAAYGYDAA